MRNGGTPPVAQTNERGNNLNFPSPPPPPQWARQPQDSAVRSRALQAARQGCPPSLRGIVWLRGIGNTLQVTPTLYESSLSRAEATRLALERQAARHAAEAADFDDDVATPYMGLSISSKFVSAGPLPTVETEEEKGAGRVIVSVLRKKRNAARKAAVEQDTQVRPAIEAFRAVQPGEAGDGGDDAAEAESEFRDVASPLRSAGRRDGGGAGAEAFPVRSQAPAAAPPSSFGPTVNLNLVAEASPFLTDLAERDLGEELPAGTALHADLKESASKRGLFAPKAVVSGRKAAKKAASAAAEGAAGATPVVLLVASPSDGKDGEGAKGKEEGEGEGGSSVDAYTDSEDEDDEDDDDDEEEDEKKARTGGGVLAFLSAAFWWSSVGKKQPGKGEGEGNDDEPPSEMAAILAAAEKALEEASAAAVAANASAAEAVAAAAAADEVLAIEVAAGRRKGAHARAGATSTFTAFTTNVISSSVPMHGNEGSVVGLETDLERTFPAYRAFFAPGSYPRSLLQRVLAAYAFFRPDHGYIQGMSHIAAVLILTVGSLAPSEEDLKFIERAKRHKVTAAEEAEVFSWQTSALTRARTAAREQAAAEAAAEAAEENGMDGDGAVVVAAAPSSSSSSSTSSSFFTGSWLTFGGGSSAASSAAAAAARSGEPSSPSPPEVFVPSGDSKKGGKKVVDARTDAEAAAVALPSLPSEVLVFQCFTNLMARAPLRWLASRDVNRMEGWYALYSSVLLRSAPKLAAFLDEVGAAPNLYLVSWLLTLFSKPLGLEASARLWDICLVGGHPEVLRCAVGLARYLEPRLLGRPFERVMRTLANVPPEFQNPFAVVECAEAVKLTAADMAKLAAMDLL